MHKERYCATKRYFERTRNYKRQQGEHRLMGKQERKRLVLTFLAETRLALPPKALFRNLRLQENATFSEKSLNNYLAELDAEGFVRRVDPEAIEQRNIIEVGDDERGYYLITEAGVEEAAGHESQFDANWDGRR